MAQDRLSSPTDEEFFSFAFATTSDSQTGVNEELLQYLNDESKQLENLHKFPIVKELFLRFNTAIPSSAPVERLFSAGGQILTLRRNRLSDDNFQMMLLLKANKTFKRLHLN
jgi:hypothetical protein